MRLAKKGVVTAAGAPNTIDVSSWFETSWRFYLVGSSTWAAQFSVDAYGNYVLDLYSSAVDENSGCQYTLWDETYGVLFLKTYNGAPYLYFSCTSGTETIWDTCFGQSGTSPNNDSHAWFITALDPAGDAWMFDNANFTYPFNHIEFRSGALGAAAVQAAASRAVDKLSTLPQEFWVEPLNSPSVTSVPTRAAQVDTGPETGPERPPGRARRAK
jgi:hypothetical protein